MGLLLFLRARKRVAVSIPGFRCAAPGVTLLSPAPRVPLIFEPRRGDCNVAPGAAQRNPGMRGLRQTAPLFIRQFVPILAEEGAAGDRTFGAVVAAVTV